MITLYICEKPSLAQKLSNALGGGKKTPTHFYSDSWVIAWCVGHFYELYEPSDYDVALKKRTLESLPIVPDRWMLKPKKKFSKNIKAIRGLIKTANKVVNVGDPDREGQLLVDQLLQELSYTGKVYRLWPKKTTPKGLAELASKLENNSLYQGYRLNAQTRQRADWLVGMNLSRYYNIKYGSSLSKDRFISVGRVQTPTLGIVVKRQNEIEGFVPTEHYVIKGVAEHNSEEFELKWLPADSLTDESGLCLNRLALVDIVKDLNKGRLKVSELETHSKSSSCPLPYTLAKLQSDASKTYNIGIDKSLKCAQTLYEKHELITYPRTDCQYLEEESYLESETVINLIKDSFTFLSEEIFDLVDFNSMPKAFDDNKVGAHAGIIPTDKKPVLSDLTKDELNLYTLICKRYVQQFLPTFDTSVTEALFSCNNQTFKTKGTIIESLGWKVLDAVDLKDKVLPKLEKGEVIDEVGYEIKKQITKPPKYFTKDTLLTAMTNISRYVTNSEIKKILSETDGLGTEATKTGIIMLLLERGYLEEFKIGKVSYLRATHDGKLLIDFMPADLKDPSFTALWEKRLKVVEQKADSGTADAFINATVKWIDKIVKSDEKV